MHTQKSIEEQESTSTPKREDNVPQLSAIFDSMSTVSNAVNKIAAPPTQPATSPSLPSVFQGLQMLTRMPLPVEEHVRRKKLKLDFNVQNVYSDNLPHTPSATHSRWAPQNVTPLPFMSYIPSPIFPIPPISDEPMTDDELIKMKGPSRLIGFLVHIAMNEKARRALRWTGNGLEFVLVNKELVAKMWGNRKHNTKDMDYYKLSRAIREKYEKKDKNPKFGKLKKGTRTYSYVFTDNSYQDLINQTEKSIDFITNFATQIGNKYHDNNDLNNSSSPLAPSPLNSD